MSQTYYRSFIKKFGAPAGLLLSDLCIWQSYKTNKRIEEFVITKSYLDRTIESIGLNDDEQKIAIKTLIDASVLILSVEHILDAEKNEYILNKDKL